MALFVSGICGAGLLALGSQIVFPLDTTISGMCNLIGIVSTIAFVGLLDGK